MLQSLKPKPDVTTQDNSKLNRMAYQRTLPAMLATAFVSVLFLSSCQQQSDSDLAVEKREVKTEAQRLAEDSKPMPQSDSAAARIEQFQPLYVSQLQGLQRRLQAEYESLQAADMSDSETDLLTTDGQSTDTDTNAATPTTANDAQSNSVDNASATDTPATDSEVLDIDTAEAEINTSTEVGERDLTVLKRISLEPRKPEMLSEEQIIARYQQAMQALYQPVTTPISAQDADTLLTVATLLPQLFEHAEIANRLNAKSPALARLIIQHQVWEQIEAQQVIDMQRMKQAQKQEFETLMAKFNETIEDYDKQIAKYEQTLKEFQ